MKTLKTITLIIFVFFCNSLFSQDIKQFEGKWKEHWGIGNVTDIEYNDVFIIFVDNDKIYINCENYDKYIFRKIVYDGEELSFEILNTTANDIIPYLLKLSKDKKWLKGTAVSAQGESVNIKWERMIDK
ncbi:hypothetical protein [Kaistella sp.]|uniref:hypothetical protein n=1 Tax=Kaistella sp. TaxID=2782235 RepID=UPI002F958B3B